jgi:hypothetical protein
MANKICPLLFPQLLPVMDHSNVTRPSALGDLIQPLLHLPKTLFKLKNLDPTRINFSHRARMIISLTRVLPPFVLHTIRPFFECLRARNVAQNLFAVQQ